MKLKNILAGVLLAITAISLVAEARPMGGGRSIGRQSQNVSRMPAAPAPTPAAPRQAAPAPAAPPAAVPPKPASPWKGILGGALLGLGLGALFSHFGMGGGIFGTILMAVLAFFLISMLLRAFRGRQAAPAGAPAAFNGNGNNIYSMPQSAAPAAAAPAAAPAHQPWGVPADFDTAGFLRVAKSNFIRLQAAWDKGDVADIREFTSPEVFAELKMQITERGAQADYTDVVSIEAELLGIEAGDSDYLASVKFYGAMKPAPDALAEPFQEVWNLVKPKSGASGWMLAGIQQLA